MAEIETEGSDAADVAKKRFLSISNKAGCGTAFADGEGGGAVMMKVPSGMACPIQVLSSKQTKLLSSRVEPLVQPIAFLEEGFADSQLVSAIVEPRKISFTELSWGSHFVGFDLTHKPLNPKPSVLCTVAACRAFMRPLVV